MKNHWWYKAKIETAPLRELFLINIAELADWKAADLYSNEANLYISDMAVNSRKISAQNL